jgi:hypothetical protein
MSLVRHRKGGVFVLEAKIASSLNQSPKSELKAVFQWFRGFTLPVTASKKQRANILWLFTLVTQTDVQLEPETSLLIGKIISNI